MSKFGWDLPPGVTTNMLPGNSAQDQADEALAERIWNILKPLREFSFIRISSNLFTDNAEGKRIHENVELEIAKLVSEAYAKGYNDCKRDEVMERSALAQDKEPI